MKPGWTEVALGEVVTLAERFEAPMPGKRYRQLGVRLWGEGAYERESIDGAETQYPVFNRCETGDLVLNKIWARNGSISVVPATLGGCFVSNEFPLFSATSSVSSAWLRLITKTPWFWKSCDDEAQGTSGKNRIKPSEFLKIRIPLPPLAEQQRIAARLDAIESRLARVRQLREDAKAERNALTTSLHISMSAGRSIRFDSLLALREEECPVLPDGSYPQVGIRSFGLGLFKKPAVVGTATTYRTFNVLRPGMFVMSQVKGWEGAIGVCGGEFDGWFVSPEYRTFECIENECHPAYLAHLAPTPWFRDQLAAATRGVGARRERIRPEMLLGMEMPFPSFKQQKDAINLLDRVQRVSALSDDSSVSESALLPSLLDQIFN